MDARAYEPSITPLKHLPTANVRLEVENLSSLSVLLKPGNLIRKLVPHASRTRHAIFVVEQEENRVFIPAMLFIRALWLWSFDAGSALMTPNSVDLYVGRSKPQSGTGDFFASPVMASSQPSAMVIRRLMWLAQCADARLSWSNVLINAHLGELGLILPKAGFGAWAWGVQLEEGLLACELLSPQLSIQLPNENASMRVGGVVHACPPPPVRRKGIVRF